MSMVVDGISLCIGANNAPKGKHLVSNNKSHFGGERKQWYIDEDEWRELYRRGRAIEALERTVQSTDAEKDPE